MSAAPIVYTLKFPLELKNKEGEVTGKIETLSLRRLNGRDMEALDNAKGSGSMMLVLIARSSDQATSVIRLMDGEDISRAGEIVSGFLGGASRENSDS
jgi:hypothetical protein